MTSSEETCFIKKISITILFISILTTTSIFLFKLGDPKWTYTGDTVNSFSKFVFQYSGMVRGEYVTWNPLVRSGESEFTQQGTQLASPLSNLPLAIGAILGVQDVAYLYTFHVLLMIYIFLCGIYLLIYQLTREQPAAVAATILASGTATIFYANYHISYLLILHSTPLFIFSVIRYFERYELKSIVIMVISLTSMLYSYQCIMPASFIATVGTIYACLNPKQAFTIVFKELPKRTRWFHVTFFIVSFTVIFLPALIMFSAFSSDLIAISRIGQVQFTDNYDVNYVIDFKRILIPSDTRKFWITSAYGLVDRPINTLRQYFGPILLVLSLFSLLSRSKKSLLFFMSAIVTLLIANDVWPFYYIFKLPVIKVMRNTQFLLHYFILCLVCMAGLSLARERSNSNKAKICCLAFLFTTFTFYNFVIDSGPLTTTVYLQLTIAIASVISISLAYAFALKKTYVTILLVSLLFFTTYNTLLYTNMRFWGTEISTPFLQEARNKTNHNLQFSFIRADNPIKREVNDKQTSLGDNEYTSYITLEDNSYRSRKGSGGLSSLPMLKSYYLLSHVDGYPSLMKNKFHFFTKCYESTDPSTMTIVKRHKILTQLLEKNICVVNNIKNDTLRIPGELRNRNSFDNISPPPLGQADIMVRVNTFNANSINLSVKARSNGILTYTDVWTPHWETFVNGQHVETLKVFETYKGVELSPGDYEITFSYFPPAAKSIVAMNIYYFFCFFLLCGLLVYEKMSSPRNKLYKSQA